MVLMGAIKSSHQKLSNMKNRIYVYAIQTIISAFLIILSSCNKDEDETPTISGLISDRSSLTTLNTAIIKGGLVAKLNGTEQLTFLAPTNDAFAAAEITPAVLEGLPSNDVANILYYHVIPGKILAADMPAGPNAKVLTYNGDSVFVTKNINGVFVNGIKVSEPDVLVSNGVIHTLSEGVLKPAPGNTLVTAAANGLDSLVKALNYAATGAGGDPSLATFISNDLLTVFAPSNAAFTTLLATLDLTDITQIPIATLIATLKFHVVQGRVFSSDLTNGNLTMLSGGVSTITLPSGVSSFATISGLGSVTNIAKITKTNFIARNGVIHVIDKVLIPN
jgi:uncharacterized surface protein with fasciclin (FAS1) repeats